MLPNLSLGTTSFNIRQGAVKVTMLRTGVKKSRLWNADIRCGWKVKYNLRETQVYRRGDEMCIVNAPIKISNTSNLLKLIETKCIV